MGLVINVKRPFCPLDIVIRLEMIEKKNINIHGNHKHMHEVYVIMAMDIKEKLILK